MIIRCYDSISGNRVQRKHCGVKQNRPRAEHMPCNTFRCEADWAEGEWEHCDKTCGKTGTQYRSGYAQDMHTLYRTYTCFTGQIHVVQDKYTLYRTCTHCTGHLHMVQDMYTWYRTCTHGTGHRRGPYVRTDEERTLCKDGGGGDSM